MSYLDDTGLAYFWTKIKAYVSSFLTWANIQNKPSTFAPSAHSHGNITDAGELGTASRAVVTDGNKKVSVSSVTSTELGYLSGVTSNVQTQLNGKAASSDIPAIPSLSRTISGSGNAITDITVSGHAITATKGSTFLTSVSGTAGTSTLAWNSEVTLYTVGGHAIKAKLPANPNTDTLVTQNVSTTSARYPILCCPTADATANQGAKTSIFASGVKVRADTSELMTVGANAHIRQVQGNYGIFWRNDGSTFYLLKTASGDAYGGWDSTRPLTVNLSTGICNINGNAATATKATQDGSGNTITSTYLPLSGGTLTGTLYGTNVIAKYLFAIQNDSITKGTAPSSGTYYWTLNFADKNGTNFANNTLAQLESRISTDNKVYFYMRAMKNAAATSTNAEMGVVYDTNNNTGWAYAPEMRISGHAKVAGYIINNRANPAFEGVVDGFTKGSKPSSTIDAGFYVHGQNTTFTEATRLGAFAVHVYDDKSTSVNLGAYKNVSGSTDSFILTVKCNVDGTGYVAHPNPTNTAENSILSATTHWVRVATGNFACNAASATKLATARAFRTHLDSTATADFDGTASCAPGVTGTLPIGNGGTGATTAAAARTNLGCAASSHTHDYLPLTGGNMTGNIVFNTTGTVGIRKGNATSLLEVSGGSALNKGARLALYGESHASYAGRFDLIAGASSTSRSLVGTSNGNITWNGAVIQTSSDARLKTPLSDVPDAVLDAWEDVRWGQFKMLDAVEEKGEENARFHVGLIAQQAKASFEARGLDGCAYGILCYENDAFDDLWMVRYAEALCMEASYQRRENARLKKRVSDLEERLAALELRLGSE